MAALKYKVDPPKPSRSSTAILSTSDSCTHCQGGSSHSSGKKDIDSNKYLKRHVMHIYGTHTFEYDGWSETIQTHKTWKIPGKGQTVGSPGLVDLISGGLVNMYQFQAELAEDLELSLAQRIRLAIERLIQGEED